MPEDVPAQLERIEGVLSLKLTENANEEQTLELKISNRAQVLPRLLQIIINSGTEIHDCQLKELPLEEIFTHALQSEQKGKD